MFPVPGEFGWGLHAGNYFQELGGVHRLSTWKVTTQEPHSKEQECCAWNATWECLLWPRVQVGGQGGVHPWCRGGCGCTGPQQVLAGRAKCSSRARTGLSLLTHALQWSVNVCVQAAKNHPDSSTLQTLGRGAALAPQVMLKMHTFFCLLLKLGFEYLLKLKNEKFSVTFLKLCADAQNNLLFMCKTWTWLPDNHKRWLLKEMEYLFLCYFFFFFLCSQCS